MTDGFTAEDARRAARNASALAAVTLLSRGIQLGWSLLFVRLVTEAAFGVYGAVSSFTQIGLALVAFGMSPLLVRDVARRPAQAGAYLATALFIQTLLAGLVYAGLSATAALGGYDEAVRFFLALAALNLFIDLPGNLCHDLLLAREHMRSAALVSLGHVVLLVSLSALGALAGWSLFGVYVGMAAAGLARSTALVALVRRAGIRPVWPLQRLLARSLLRDSAPLALGQFIGLAYTQAGNLLTNRFVGNVETAYLTAALLVNFGLIELLSGSVVTATYPLLSRTSVNADDARFGFLIGKLAFFSLVLALPLALVMTFHAPALLTPIFGARYQTTGELMQVFIWQVLLVMPVNLIQQGYLAQNRQGQVVQHRLIGLTVNLSLLTVLLPGLGVLGAPVAALVAEGIMTGLHLLRFRAAGWSLRAWLGSALRLLPPGLLAGAVLWLTLPLGPILSGLLGVVCYGAALLALRIFGEEELDLLYRLAAALPGGGLVRRYWRRATPITWE